LPKGIRATAVCAASPDGQTLAYADDSGVIRLVDANEGTQLQTLETPGASYSQLAFSPDGRDLAAGGTSRDQVHVAVWDLSNGQVVHRWDWPKGRDTHCSVESICFTPDGRRLAAAVFRQSSACLWDLTTGQQIAQLTHGQVYGLSFSPDSKTLATAGWDRVVRLWEADTGKLRREVRVADKLGNDRDVRMYTVCFAPRGGLIATAHLSGTVGVWDAADMTLRSVFKVEGRFIYGSIDFSPDASLLATGNMSGNVALWDPLTAEKIRDIGRHQSYVYTVGFGRDGQTLLSGGRDGVCYLWNLQPRDTQPGKDPNR
jgi:WD40 repeat protein